MDDIEFIFVLSLMFFVAIVVPIGTFCIGKYYIQSSKKVFIILGLSLIVFIIYDILNIGLGVSFRGDNVDYVILVLQYFCFLLLYFSIKSKWRRITDILIYPTLSIILLFALMIGPIVFTGITQNFVCKKKFYFDCEEKNYEVREYEFGTISSFYLSYRFDLYEIKNEIFEKRISSIKFTGKDNLDLEININNNLVSFDLESVDDETIFRVITPTIIFDSNN